MIGTRALELTPGLDLDRTLFIVPNMMDALAHEAVLCRPPRMTLAAAKEEAARAISMYLRS